MIVTRSVVAEQQARHATRVETWVEDDYWHYSITVDGTVRDFGVLGPVDEH